ncbi:threonylcarbamoyl-AMP synthase [bacterium]|nr:threonylcarbamoyl-AMP synthase [bacterium]
MAKARVIPIHPEHPQPRLVKQAADVLRGGGIVVHPTDTTYAMGVAVGNKHGVETMYRLKKKSLTRPLSFLCRDLSNIAEFAKLTDEAYRTMRRLLPGPYTFILDATKTAPRFTQTARKEIGIRIPNDAICMAIIEELGEPLVSTSAYIEGGDLLSDPEDIERVLGGYVDLIVDAGVIVPEPSTIISFVEGGPTLIRQGKGAFDLFDVGA